MVFRREAFIKVGIDSHSNGIRLSSIYMCVGNVIFNKYSMEVITTNEYTVKIK
jgi:hypothetical protein